jgi:hypothetical protein
VRVLTVLWVLAASWLYSVPALAAAPSEPLATLLAKFQAQAGADHAKQVSDAITASPPLQARLEKLTVDGALKGFDLVGPDDEVMDANKGAEIVSQHILLTTKFLLNQPPQRRVAATGKADLDPPDNLVFVLGHLSYHLEHPLDRKSLPADLAEKAYVVVGNEAQAYLQGWNDLIDAEAKLKGRPITTAEAASLLPNFRYRSFFIKANGKLAEVSPDGQLAPTRRNLRAMTSALFESEVPDFD